MEILLSVVGVGVAVYFLSSIKEHLESIDSSLHKLDDIRTDIGAVVGKLENIKEEGKEIKKAVKDVSEKVSDIDSSVDIIKNGMPDKNGMND